MEEFYKNKYLKYKDKYFNKCQQGGVCTNCAKVGFQQHNGECWHDSFSTIMLFSDDFSEGIQKILNAEFDAATRIRKVTSRPDIYHKFFLPPNILETGPEFEKFCTFSTTYLTNLNKLYQIELKPLEKRIDAGKLSISCVAQSFNVNNINRIEENKYDRYNHSGSYSYHIINSCVYNYFLREPGSKYLIIKKFALKDISQENIKEFLDLLPKCFGIYISLRSIDNDSSSGHATGFFQCKNKKYFFDDNGISDDPKDKKTFVEFDWKIYLTDKMNKLLKSKEFTFTIISDFLKGHDKPESKYGREYLEDFLIYGLILFIAHDVTSEDDYHKNNYENYKELICFSTDKITHNIIKYIKETDTDLIDVLFNCVLYNNIKLLKELTKRFKLNLSDFKKPYDKSTMSLLAKSVMYSKTMNETIKFLLEYKFDFNEVLIDEITNFNLFLYAVENGNIEFVKFLLSKNKSLINSTSLDGKTGLYVAVSLNNYDMVELLINNNIDISIKFENTISPLYIALEYNVYSFKVEYYENILEHGEPSKLFNRIENDENNFFESNKKIIKKLLDNNALRYEKNINEIISQAFINNNYEGVLLLFDKRYNIKINFNDLINGKTLLEYSIMYKNNFITEYNLKKDLREFIFSRDMARNIAIVNMLLKQKLSKKTITSAIETAQKEKKTIILRKLLEIKI